MSSPAMAASTISPLRTPRDRDWPTPMMLRAPDSFASPTTAQIFDVPTSRPTMTDDWSNMFFPVEGGFLGFGGGGRQGGGIEPEDRRIVGDGEIDRKSTCLNSSHI